MNRPSRTFTGNPPGVATFASCVTIQRCGYFMHNIRATRGLKAAETTLLMDRDVT
jgi:hypothetical protein